MKTKLFSLALGALFVPVILIATKQTASLVTCLSGYEVQEQYNSQSWASLATLGPLVNAYTVKVVGLGAHQYRVLMQFTDGTNIISNTATVTATFAQPSPPLNLTMH